MLARTACLLLRVYGPARFIALDRRQAHLLAGLAELLDIALSRHRPATLRWPGATGAAGQPRLIGPRARYDWPVKRVIVLRRMKSRTVTTPRLTCVSVPSHWFFTLQTVPRTVAALSCPRAVKCPCPLELSWPSTLLLRWLLAIRACLPSVVQTCLALRLLMMFSSVRPFCLR